MSKGSKPRPMTINRNEFAKRHDHIFRKPKITVPVTPPEQPIEQPTECANISVPGTPVK